MRVALPYYIGTTELYHLYYIIAGQFAMSHGSYDSNLGSEILILGGDIRSRSWLNIGDSYGMYSVDRQ